MPVERVHTVLVTHSHPDHFGGAGRLRAEHDCAVVAHEDFVTPFDRGDRSYDADLEELHDTAAAPDDAAVGDGAVGEAGSQGHARLRDVLFGDGELPEIPARITPWGGEGFRPSAEELEHMRNWDTLSKQGLLSLQPTVKVVDEEILTIGGTEWVVVHTPGHTGDHICLFDPVEGTLLSGDHVLPTITPHISGLTPRADALAQFFDALRRVAAIEGVRTVLPAHGLPFSDLAGRVDEIIEHHHDRLELLAGLGDELGEAPVVEYSHRLFRPRSWGPMADSETYAHLEHLRLDGRMERSFDDDGLARYRPTA